MRGRFLPPLFLCALLLGLLSVPCAAADSQPVRLETSVSGRTVTVQFLAAQALTLTNYDVKLNWDTDAFTLEAITNAQGGKFPNFMSNPQAGSISTAAISNVHIGAGETLASFTLTAADSAQGSYAFTLQVTAAADENGDSLPWQGARLEAAAQLTLDLETCAELTLSGTLAEARVVCFEQDAIVCCAVYGEGRRMLSRNILPVYSDGAEHSYEFDLSGLAFRSIKLFLLDKTWQPLYAAQMAQPSGNTP